MRHSNNRSAIYVVIGIGLFILVMSQFWRSDQPSNASFVASSNPFESLEGYQPGLNSPKIVEPTKLIVGEPRLVVASPNLVVPSPKVIVEDQQSVKRLPRYDEIVTDMAVPAKNLTEDFTSHFVGTPSVPDVPNATVEPVVENPSFENIEVATIEEVTSDEVNESFDLAITDVEEFVPAATEAILDEATEVVVEAKKVTLAEATEAMVEATEALVETKEVSLEASLDEAVESFELAMSDVEELPATLSPEIKRTSTEMPAFRNTTPLNQNQIVNHRLGQSSQPRSTNLQNTRWKKNPFITNETLPAAGAGTTDTSSNDFGTKRANTIASDTLPPAVESLIKSEFDDSSDQLSTVANLEAVTEYSGDAMLPAIDNDTMHSVVATNDNLESGPSIMVGVSEADAQKAVHNIEYGKSLSRRGASFAARQEFYSSLRILAQSHDKQVGGTNYTQALRNGILALKEAQDFIVTDTETQIGLNVANVIEAHSTEVISKESAESMTAIEAVQRYFAYASHQLSRCGGQNVVSTEALYCLGKLHSVQASNGPNASKLDVAKSMVFHRAAISADPRNFRSLNELGVLYANNGRFSESKSMLKESLRISQLPQAWKNLSVIHKRMGENNLAELAKREYEISSTKAPSSVIRWAPVDEFNENAPIIQRTAAQVNNLVPNKSIKESAKSLGSRILDSLR